MVRPLIILERALARTAPPKHIPSRRGQGNRYTRSRGFLRFERKYPGAVWNVIDLLARTLTASSMPSDAITSILIQVVPDISEADLRYVSQKLWLSWTDEVEVRSRMKLLMRGGLQPESPFWSELALALESDTQSIWSLVPITLVVQRFIRSVSPVEHRDALLQQFAAHTFAADYHTTFRFLRHLQHEYRQASPHPRKVAQEPATDRIRTPVPQAEEPTSPVPVPEPVEDTTPAPPPDPEPPPDPVLAWVMRMNGSRYDHLLDRIHRLADAWRQDVEPRESLLEPMAAVVLNLEKFLRSGGLRPRYPVGKHLTLGLEESADFEYAGTPFDGTSKQVLVTRPGWIWNGEPIGRPTVIEAPAVVPSP
jgi:hypothetical protein